MLDAQTGAKIGTFTGEPPPAFAGHISFYFSGNTLEAHDLATDATIWRFAGDGNLVTGSIVDNGTVYVGSSTGNLYGIDAVTGVVSWSANTAATA